MSKYPYERQIPNMLTYLKMMTDPSDDASTASRCQKVYDRIVRVHDTFSVAIPAVNWNIVLAARAVWHARELQITVSCVSKRLKCILQ